MSDHIVTAYDRELADIRSHLLELGGLAETQLERAMDALVGRKPELARQVMQSDDRVDELHRLIGEAVLLIVGRRQPVADDLRTVFAAGQVAQALERMGDLSANIAKRSLALSRYTALAPAFSVGMFAQSVRRLVALAMQAFAEENAALALEVWQGDQDIDRHHTNLFRETLTAMEADRAAVVPGAHLLFVLKNLERIGDYATTIAEAVHYSATGRYPEGSRPKADSTSQWTPG